MKEHTLFNGSKGLIYINNNDLSDLESFKQGLKEIYPIIDIERATWIKPRYPTRGSDTAIFGR